MPSSANKFPCYYSDLTNKKRWILKSENQLAQKVKFPWSSTFFSRWWFLYNSPEWRKEDNRRTLDSARTQTSDMQKYSDLWGRTVPDIIDPENSTPKFGIIKNRVQDVKSRLQPRFDWRFLLLIWSFMTVKIILLMSVTPERKSASPIGLALKTKKTAMWQEDLEITTDYDSFYLSPLYRIHPSTVIPRVDW